MEYIKKLFADPKMYNEVEFGKKIHEENVLLKLMQEIFPEEHVVQPDFVFPKIRIIEIFLLKLLMEKL
ncbi:hypothetical protein SD917_06080 [Lactobacillus paragasseri]|uniref:hypothetical protein n=1 Tax=Lactobacillus paragasseri TaxID=2107999 RepID=UPI0029C50C00|nr:hypothetical protein [Lactobacillus paragasseri]MDX5116915.1 hypothetical protein [Lactobacillus paragasseri]MDX5139236.1 hypothetical protein [Lactobacillus paragasseri]MDX5144698.1 hypothetical protein [Lactobacillus paragasseri]